jgi:hypothetical protein
MAKSFCKIKNIGILPFGITLLDNGFYRSITCSLNSTQPKTDLAMFVYLKINA